MQLCKYHACQYRGHNQSQQTLGLRMQVIEAADGAKAVHDAWPAFHKSTVHASPLLHDFDFDGILDILVATYDGEIRIFKDTVSICMIAFAYV